jgi:hypothetical protein
MGKDEQPVTFMTVSKLIKKLQLFEREGYGDLPIIYSSDDEGNSYSVCYFSPVLAQVKDIKANYLDLIGFPVSDRVTKENCNCVCIN